VNETLVTRLLCFATQKKAPHKHLRGRVSAISRSAKVGSGRGRRSPTQNATRSCGGNGARERLGRAMERPQRRQTLRCAVALQSGCRSDRHSLRCVV